ncbi:type I-F CRISPR-associated helicase Cas3f [Limnobacter sp.]|uniref:type I-F CRISPR-associated helicase Cas3f n=1 Tax=Limnobacter sp. TaxID=2003368 RepID=UPI002FE0A09D
MMVTFVSQCEKKALARSRRVLDAFANRIGNNTWQTVITEDGLLAVKKLLRKTATKNTAVACHWLRSRSRSELAWVVGNRKQFSPEGVVPVNLTQKNISPNEWENNWAYLPCIKSLVAVAALLHDWGKATVLFQKKLLQNQKKGDPLRHEWISCLLFKSLVVLSGNTDEGWLNAFASGALNEKAIQKQITEFSEVDGKSGFQALHELPPIAQLVCWLIVSHHRLPNLRDKGQRNHFAEESKSSLVELLKSVTERWGYENRFDEDDFKNRLKQCFQFSNGLLSDSSAWMKSLKKWATRLLGNVDPINTLIENGTYRIVLHHARLCLMLGDHYYSSQASDNKWNSVIDLWANTDDKKKLKQKLDEHLVHVCDQGLRVSQSLSRFTTDMGMAQDVKSLKQKSPPAFAWQDKAVEKVNRFKKSNESSNTCEHGWFVVNMASTGCGKTLANAKIMQALSNSGEDLRYVLALGLRTLTLQTGDAYRQQIGLDNDELAVLVGSAAVQELHNEKQKADAREITFEESGSESAEELLGEELDYEDAPSAEFLNAILRTEKDKAFLYKPVLACTIDHIIAATETIKGGRYILPSLRLLSSDLVIDEVDDFDGKDLIAIGRLVHLAGMLGRKVMISSATIPPALVEGFFHAYAKGWQLHCNFMQVPQKIACAWVDEFDSAIEHVENTDDTERCMQYQKVHQDFVEKRIKQIKTQPAKRKAIIADCSNLMTTGSGKAERESQQQYFKIAKNSCIGFHSKHHYVDPSTGKCISFGVVRVANIPPCVALTQYLLETDWPTGFTPKVMAYHSRQVLLLRSEQERHLDSILKRNEKPNAVPQALQNPIIRQHIDNTDAENLLFIVVATPVEEVGRDHDFDWAVVEPSSYRSIIQLAGRVRRHRTMGVDSANVGIMQYNLKALRNKSAAVFCRPGYESNNNKLNTTDIHKLLDEKELAEAITAIPRIAEVHPLNPKTQLADLEHHVIRNSLTTYDKKGPASMQGWLKEAWWLTGLPQQFNRFREGAPTKSLFLVWKDGALKFCERSERGEFIAAEKLNNIERPSKLNSIALERLWLVRSYEELLLERCTNAPFEDEDRCMQKQSKRYGEITVNAEENPSPYFYSDHFGMWPKDSK